MVAEEKPEPEERKVPTFVTQGSSAPASDAGLASIDRRIEKKVWTLKRIASIGAVGIFVGLVGNMALFGDHSA